MSETPQEATLSELDSSAGDEVRTESSAERGAFVESAAHDDELIPQPRPVEGKRMKIIDRGSLSLAIASATERALSRYGDELSDGAREALGRSVRLEVLSSIQRHGKRVRGMTRRQFLVKLERARNETLVARDQARDELLALNEQLDESRTHLAGPGETMPKVDLTALEGKLGELFRASSAGELDAGELQSKAMESAHAVALAEVERLYAERTAKYRTEVDLFERRIAKLKASLEETERALAEVARLKTIDPGVASVYKTVQGLSDGEEMRQRKAEMLTLIFEANRELQAG